MSERRICRVSSTPFLVSDEDAAFYSRMGVPPPTLCPEERSRRRLAFRNERNFYRRNCDLTGQSILSMYSPNRPHRIYARDVWWDDSWDQYQTGRPFDFNRTFFEQFQELLEQAPLTPLFASNNENSDYVNYETDDKDCYLSVGGHFNRDSHYNTYSIHGIDCIDNYWAFRCELLYGSINCFQCYDSAFLENCHECTNCCFGFDLRGCTNCFGCIGLRNKTGHLFNQPTDEAAIQALRKKLGSFAFFCEMKDKVRNFFQSQPHRAVQLESCENCTGDYLSNCKDCAHAFESEDVEDSKFLSITASLKNCYDLDSVGWGELVYEVVAGGFGLFNTRFSALLMEAPESTYCYGVFHSKHLFGCVGLSHAEHCIFNKHYNKNDYEKLLERIISHMRDTGEWGEFFPVSISPFFYNDTVASQYFPLTQDEAHARGYHWKSNNQAQPNSGQALLPDAIAELHDTSLTQVFSCDNCSKPYRIILQELRALKKAAIPAPRLCPACRHLARIQAKNPHQLWQRQCSQCGKDTLTSFSPERIESAYCDSCYKDWVYGTC